MGDNSISRLQGAVLRALDAGGDEFAAARSLGPEIASDKETAGSAADFSRLQDTVLQTYRAATQSRPPRLRFDRSRHGL
jgi:hypothetical protein